MCEHCVRPTAACICNLAPRVQNDTEVLLLQHPMERKHPKGTARLLHLSLTRSRMEEGEVWEPRLLQDMLYAPWAEETGIPALTLLLYPPLEADPGLPLLMPPTCTPQSIQQAQRQGNLRLVVIDGTWRKSRKMLYLNSALQRLPRLPLQQIPPSRYAIRKAHQAGQLSTLEATYLALSQLEPSNHALEQLLDAMDNLQARYQAQLTQRI